MADLRPFAPLIYDSAVAGDAATLVAPPYDVVSAADREALYARSGFNIAHVDYGPERPGDSDSENRYTRARALLGEWLAKGVLRRGGPGLFVYDQEFSLRGRAMRRRAVFGRLRLARWEEGVVLPHENTLAAPKRDRLELLRRTRVNLSPILAMYAGVDAMPGDGDLGPPLLDARLPAERHCLRPVAKAAATRLCQLVADRRLYVADGHHRYETALAYRDERRAAAREWTGEEAENFVLAALVDVADPGLVVLPIHRIVRHPEPPADAIDRLAAYFEVEHLPAPRSEADVDAFASRLGDAGRAGSAIGVVGLAPGRAQILRRKGRAGDELLPAGHAGAWRDLDVNVLHHVVFPTIGYTAGPEAIEFTEDHMHAAMSAGAEAGRMAFMLNPTGVDQVIACADAGERMPQKSTFFYPKLATGVVLYPLD